ncbi:MAG: hypothetical protein ACREXT_19345 [Gammaproteobacteria bacterium]
MWGVARLAMRGPLTATFAVAGFALLALIFAPLLMVSGGLLGLVTLRRGLLEGLRITVFAGALTGGVLMLLNGRLGAAAAAIFAAWLPIIGASQTLRRTGQQGLAFVNIGICVAAYAALMRVANPDVDGFWRERLARLGDLVKAQGGRFLNENEVALIGGMMHEVSVALLCITLIGMLLMARWWQSGLYNPGGFRTEFQALALPRWSAWVTAAAALVSVLLASRGGAGVAGDLTIVLVILFSLQGLAIVHAVCAAKALAGGWLIGLYVLLGIVPQIALPLLAAVGIADGVGDFRARVKPRP